MYARSESGFNRESHSSFISLFSAASSLSDLCYLSDFCCLADPRFSAVPAPRACPDFPPHVPLCAPDSVAEPAAPFRCQLHQHEPGSFLPFARFDRRHPALASGRCLPLGFEPVARWWQRDPAAQSLGFCLRLQLPPPRAELDPTRQANSSTICFFIINSSVQFALSFHSRKAEFRYAVSRRDNSGNFMIRQLSIIFDVNYARV